MYTGDPTNNPYDRVRVYITDTDNNELLVDQSVIEFYYDEAGQNAQMAAIKCLNYLIFTIAKMGDEKVGGVYLKNSDRLDNLKKVLAYLKANMSSGIGAAGVYAGGISVCDVITRRNDPDSVTKPVQTGTAFSYRDEEALYAQKSNGLNDNTMPVRI